MGITAANMELALPRAQLNVAVTVSALRQDAEGFGIRARIRRSVGFCCARRNRRTWREVARRVAHEIKNPLTPIALSAERIHRHLMRGTVPDAACSR